jgi:membrane-associated phospholipid phosphatase
MIYLHILLLQYDVYSVNLIRKQINIVHKLIIFLKMKKISRRIMPFLLTSMTIIVIATILILMWEKKSFHLEINKTYTPFQDFVFKYGTNIGDGLFLIIILLLLLFFFNYRKIAIGFTSFLLTSLFCRILKTIVFPDLQRPSGLFGSNELHFVEGVTVHTSHSFPSGHTATAFAVFIFMAYVFKKRYLQVLFAFTACFVGYSRVYLSQHFLIDTIGGAITGIVSFYIAYVWIRSLKAKWLNSSLTRFLNKKKQQGSVIKFG